ncbi:MAG: hypothetical protein HC890_03240 [Chloroflexaceae bacterium]|nr:hypothetical protein [Chloroflexaceae bacterium]
MGTTGTATTTFTGNPGTYDVLIGYFDESDGASPVTLNINGGPIEGSITYNNSPGGATPSASNFLESTLASGITLGAGDTITLTGIVDGTASANERARIDYIEFVPATNSFSFA